MVDVREALSVLGVRRLVLAIHDASLPSLEREDCGRGSLYSEGGRRFLRFARGLGFDAVQLGPPGATSRTNPSPYDGALFSRNPASIALFALAEDPDAALLVDRKRLDAIVARRPADRSRVHHAYVWDEARAALAESHDRFLARSEEHAGLAALATRIAAFERENVAWLSRDGLFEALAAEHGTDDWRSWGADGRLLATGSAEAPARAERVREILARRHREASLHLFCQFLVHEQHRRLRSELRPLGLKLFGDLQVGIAGRDAWALQSLFFPGYQLGAPPSRTNPDGQPWGYAILDPRPTAAGRDADRLLEARLDKMLAEHDGVRIDHPHGLVCPWVYRTDDPDPYHAVQHGARLFSSPHLPDHPALAELAIVRPEQIDASRPRHADDWVRELTDEQVERFARRLEIVLDRARAHGRETADVLCEVLSTWPRELRVVMERRGLGRFCVTQKVDPADPHDLYRSEGLRPEDWIMVGTHDTRPIWLVAERWHGRPAGAARASYLAARLVPDPARRPACAAELAADPRRLVEASFADLFVGPARNVSVFFADLLGMKEIYNTPGAVDASNWTLRVPPDYEELHRERAARGEALHLGRVLSLALHARGLGPDPGPPRW